MFLVLYAINKLEYWGIIKKDNRTCTFFFYYDKLDANDFIVFIMLCKLEKKFKTPFYEYTIKCRI